MEAALAAAAAWAKSEAIGFLRRHWPKIAAVLVVVMLGGLLLIGGVAASIAGSQDDGTVASACADLGYEVDASVYVPSGNQETIPTGGEVAGFSTGEEEQLEVARTIVSVGQQSGVPQRGLIVAIATALQESGLRNLTGGDRDSMNPFQQRPSQGWGTVEELSDVTFAARAFFGGANSPHNNPATGKASPAGLLDVDGWEQLTVTQAAQRVQRSAYPDAYARWEDRAATIVAALTGRDTTTTAGSQSSLDGLTADGFDLAAYCDENFDRMITSGYGPGAWGGYSNGRIPTSALSAIPWAPGHLLRADATEALTRLNEAYRAEFGADIKITDSYRDYDAQVRVKAQKPTLAATPGTSNHGWGLALDLGGGIETFGTTQHAWMVANAGAYGWVLPSWAQQGGSKPEPWHWEYNAPASGV